MNNPRITTYFKLNNEEMKAKVKPEPPKPEPEPPKPKPEPPKPEPKKTSGAAGCFGIIILFIGILFAFAALCVLGNSKEIPWQTVGGLLAAAAVIILIGVFFLRKGRKK